jgi:hypothetical protein
MPELQESQAFKKSQERLDLYSQVLEGMQEDAVERVDAALQEALDKHRKEIGWQKGSKRPISG